MSPPQAKLPEAEKAEDYAPKTVPTLKKSWRRFPWLKVANIAPLPAADESANKLERELYTGLDNKEGHCFRNAALIPLLHNPIFYNWLINDVVIETKDVESQEGDGSSKKEDEKSQKGNEISLADITELMPLKHVLKDLALAYLPKDGAATVNREILFEKLKTFWTKCEEEFWGGRSSLLKKTGTILGAKSGGGGSSAAFLIYLVKYLMDQYRLADGALGERREERLFRKMFWIQDITYTRCQANHVNVRTRTELSHIKIGDACDSLITVKDCIKRFLTPAAGALSYKCDLKSCTFVGGSTIYRKILNAPEILIVKTPIRAKNRGKSAFFYKVPFEEELTLADYHFDESPLTYQLHSVVLLRGWTFHRPSGHVSSVVVAPDYKLYHIDDYTGKMATNVVYGGWQTVAAKQNDSVPEDNRYLPIVFMYIRKSSDYPPTPDSPPESPKKSPKQSPKKSPKQPPTARPPGKRSSKEAGSEEPFTVVKKKNRKAKLECAL